MRVFLVFGVCSVWFLYCVTTKNLPPITCQEYFQYLTEGDQFVGKITLPDLPMETITVDLQLSQYEFATDNNVGNLSFWYDLKTANKNLENKEPIEYRVIFSTQKELPKVTRIAVNQIELCSAEDYPKPSERIALQHWFQPPNAKERKDIPLPAGFNVKYKFGED